MTKFAEYLSEAEIRQKDFAKLVDAKQSSISKLASGAALPTLPMAKKIEDVTNGAVKMSSWVEE